MDFDRYIVVNGRKHYFTGDARRPLLYFLRGELGLSGPKFGCGVGDCGACAVLIGEREARSCSVPLGDVHGDVTTLEGLPRFWGAEDGRLHPVQQAWITEQVPQCGYCQNGMIMAAVDLLGRVADPSVAEIKLAFSEPHPHLCRCGTYSAIIRAVRRAAAAIRETGVEL